MCQFFLAPRPAPPRYISNPQSRATFLQPHAGRGREVEVTGGKEVTEVREERRVRGGIELREVREVIGIRGVRRVRIVKRVKGVKR